MVFGKILFKPSRLLFLLVLFFLFSYTIPINGDIVESRLQVNKANASMEKKIVFPMDFIFIVPVDSDLKPILITRECFLADSGMSVGYTEGRLHVLANPDIYQNCFNLSSQYEIHINKTITHTNKNETIIFIKRLALFTKYSYTDYLDFAANNMTISYRKLNSTHILVTVGINGLVPKRPKTMGRDYPSDIEIVFIVDNATRKAYLVEGDNIRFIGYLPLFPPIISPEEYIENVIQKFDTYHQYIMDNPWVIESLIEKARISNNKTESSKMISGFVFEQVYKVVSFKYPYVSVKFTLSGISEKPGLAMILYRWRQPLEINNSRVMFNDTLEINYENWVEYWQPYLKEYVITNDSSVFIEAFKNIIIISNSTFNVYSITPRPINIVFPIHLISHASEEHVIYDILIPLPENMSTLFHGATYLYIKFSCCSENDRNYMVIDYGDVLEVSTNTSKWNILKNCLIQFKELFINKYLDLLNHAVYSELNMTKVDEMFKTLKKYLLSYKELLGINSNSSPIPSQGGGGLNTTSSYMPNQYSQQASNTTGNDRQFFDTYTNYLVIFAILAVAILFIVVIIKKRYG